jgi:hypothetical protein
LERQEGYELLLRWEKSRCFNILDVSSGTPCPEGLGLLTRIKELKKYEE